MMQLFLGDCLEVMPTLPASSIDTIITDPPYGLSFMGKDWDHGVPGVAFWIEALRVAKPGAHLLAFGGTRTFHHLTVAIESAGWEIRDCMMWLYGSGFPKSMNVGKAIDKAAGAERPVVGTAHRSVAGWGPGEGLFSDDNYEWKAEFPVTVPATDAAKEWEGYGTALKPAWEPIIVARKPLEGTVAANVQEFGTGALNIDDCRIPHVTVADGNLALNPHLRTHINGGNGGHIIAHEPDRRVVIPNQGGRWPANVILDEEAGAILDEQTGQSKSRKGKPRSSKSPGDGWGMTATGAEYNDAGGASRFFYCAKTSKKERGAGNNHPTVKPQALMRYLCKLTASPDCGTVLDPFMGSGSTGVAALAEGCDFIGIEKDAGYYGIAKGRIEPALPTVAA